MWTLTEQFVPLGGVGISLTFLKILTPWWYL